MSKKTIMLGALLGAGFIAGQAVAKKKQSNSKIQAVRDVFREVAESDDIRKVLDFNTFAIVGDAIQKQDHIISNEKEIHPVRWMMVNAGIKGGLL